MVRAPQVVQADQLLALALEDRPAAGPASRRCPTWSPNRPRRCSPSARRGPRRRSPGCQATNLVQPIAPSPPRRSSPRRPVPRPRLTPPVNPTFIAGLGRKASAIWAAADTGGAPNTTNPAASGSAGAASSAMCPPRLQPTITASAPSPRRRRTRRARRRSPAASRPVVAAGARLTVAGQVERQAPVALPERPGHDRVPGPGRGRVPVHEDHGAARGRCCLGTRPPARRR